LRETSYATVRLCAADYVDNVNIHHDGCDTVNATGRAFGNLPNGMITNAPGEFNNPVMYLDTDRAGDNGLFTIKLREDVLLNEQIVFHQGTPSRPNNSDCTAPRYLWADHLTINGCNGMCVHSMFISANSMARTNIVRLS
jgi:hypothetical protein